MVSAEGPTVIESSGQEHDAIARKRRLSHDLLKHSTTSWVNRAEEGNQSLEEEEEQVPAELAHAGNFGASSFILEILKKEISVQVINSKQLYKLVWFKSIVINYDWNKNAIFSNIF